MTNVAMEREAFNKIATEDGSWEQTRETIILK